MTIQSLRLQRRLVFQRDGPDGSTVGSTDRYFMAAYIQYDVLGIHECGAQNHIVAINVRYIKVYVFD